MYRYVGCSSRTLLIVAMGKTRVRTGTLLYTCMYRYVGYRYVGYRYVGYRYVGYGAIVGDGG